MEIIKRERTYRALTQEMAEAIVNYVDYHFACNERVDSGEIVETESINEGPFEVRFTIDRELVKDFVKVRAYQNGLINGFRMAERMAK